MHPTTEKIVIPTRRADNRPGTVDEQGPQVRVAAFADPEQPRLAARRVLSRHEPQPGAHLAPVVENARIADLSDESAGDQRPDTASFHQPVGARILAGQALEFARQVFDLGVEFIEPSPLPRQFSAQERGHEPRFFTNLGSYHRA